MSGEKSRHLTCCQNTEICSHFKTLFNMSSEQEADENYDSFVEKRVAYFTRHCINKFGVRLRGKKLMADLQCRKTNGWGVAVGGHQFRGYLVHSVEVKKSERRKGIFKHFLDHLILTGRQYKLKVILFEATNTRELSNYLKSRHEYVRTRFSGSNVALLIDEGVRHLLEADGTYVDTPECLLKDIDDRDDSDYWIASEDEALEWLE